MTSFTVAAGSTDANAKTVGDDDTGAIAATGVLSTTGTAITWTGGSASPGVTIDNAGSILSAGRGIDTSGSFATGSFTFDNDADASLIASSNDAIRINSSIATGTIKVDNSGLLVSGAVDANGDIIAGASGVALNFKAMNSATAVTDIINHAGASIGSSGGDAIRPGAGIVSITNDGLIDATASASRAINLNASTLANLVSFELDNRADGTIQSQGDAVRITAGALPTNAAYTVVVDNAGTIHSTGLTGANNGQAIDFNDLVSTAGQIHITNEATGLISAEDADAIRPGQNAVVDNFGHIVSHNAAGDSGDDGIDFQDNGGGVVHNESGGVIEGARHGITGDQAITITNDGEITGHLGSGINMDTASLSMSYVTNTGTITGTGGYLPAVAPATAPTPVDGDGVDVDGLLTLENYGTITAAGVHVDGELQEAVTIGGGVIDNYAGGIITSFERAITSDDSGGGGGPNGSNGSNGGDAWAPTTIYNEGLIHGGDGEAISITDTFADTITNKGTIEGSVFTGGGDDVFNFYGGSSITGTVDGGDGTDTVNLYGPGAGVTPALVNIETVNLHGGDWSLGSEGMGSVNFMGPATLALEPGVLADGHFGAEITGFGNVDTIDLEGIGHAAKATLGADNVLTISGGSGGPVTLQLDPHQSFDGYVFQLTSDGNGGTDLTLAKVINGGNGNDVLNGTNGNDVISAGNGNDTVHSGDGNDTVSGGNGNDVLTAGDGNATLDGGNGNDILTSGAGNSSLDGGNGNDILTVGNGDNILNGGNGDDTLHVGTGDNVLTGGGGDDTFVFGPVFGQDVITDFGHGDIIEIKGAFANFQALESAMHQVGSDTVIALDASHSITLTGVAMSSLHASDFFLV